MAGRRRISHDCGVGQCVTIRFKIAAAEIVIRLDRNRGEMPSGPERIRQLRAEGIRVPGESELHAAALQAIEQALQSLLGIHAHRIGEQQAQPSGVPQIVHVARNTADLQKEFLRRHLRPCRARQRQKQDRARHHERLHRRTPHADFDGTATLTWHALE